MRVRSLRNPLFASLLVALTCGFAPTVWAADPVAASNNAYNWLKAQTVSTGLTDSYKDGQDICYTYDQAVAAIAFLAKGDVARARGILDALSTMQNDDGSWNSAYACTTKTPQAAQRYVGSVAWVVLAAAQYERKTADTVSYGTMTQRALNWMLLFQQADGGINGGIDASGVTISWASTEHNENVYNGLAYFAHPTAAADVRSFLDNVVWDAAANRWDEGRNDILDPLDVNPLGVLALGATGTHNYQLALDYAMTHHRNTQVWRSGKTRVTVDGFDFNSDRNDIWLEGTAQMAAAFKVAGRTTDASYFIGQIIGIQQKDGGIPYSVKGSFNGNFKMSTAEAVASTGWLILAIEGLNPLKP